MRTATLLTDTATNLHVVDLRTVLDDLEAMTPAELHALDRRIWLADFGVDIGERPDRSAGAP